MLSALAITETHNVNIAEMTKVPSFNELARKLPLSNEGRALVQASRNTILDILEGRDSRLLLVVGPCSVHNVAEAYEYAKRLAGLSSRIKDTCFVVMRVNYDKPRSRKDWEGVMNDPLMDGSCDIALGYSLVRQLMLDITALGLAIGVEALDGDNFHIVSDLVSYAWIGARDVGTMRARKFASGISCPTGFKNHNLGPLGLAIDAIEFARHPSVFTGSDDDGDKARIKTRGNPTGHLILRGTDRGPNFSAAHVSEAIDALLKAEQNPRLLVDCSHGNSQKDEKNQDNVLRDIVLQRVLGNCHIVGALFESNLEGGRQPIPKDLSTLKPGVSVTDACRDWARTEALLLEVSETLAKEKRP